MGRNRKRIGKGAYLTKLKSEILSLDAKVVGQKQSSVVLFVSFDLVNGTAFKEKANYWAVTTSHFYELAARELKTKSPEFQLWKYIGDEILFFRIVSDVNELAKDIGKIFSAMQNMNSSIENMFEDAKKFLSVKATAWIAEVEKLSSGKLEDFLPPKSTDKAVPENILVQNFGEADDATIDFLGKEVDVGFRISKYAHRCKIVLSAHLARFLTLHAPAAYLRHDNMRIVDYAKLRGVWGGRPYPLIWYYEDWNLIGSTFYYDEEFGDDLAARVKKKPPKQNVVELAAVFEDLGKAGEIDRLREGINSQQPIINLKPETRIPVSKLAEVHCVAICFDPTGKILIAKRPKDKRTLPGKWEFGCAQLKSNQDFRQAVVEGYKEDFGIAITEVSNLPVSNFTIEGDRKIPGLIFVADVSDPKQAEKNFSKGKHTEIKWITFDEAKKLKSQDCVPDFIESVSAAIAYRLSKRAK